MPSYTLAAMLLCLYENSPVLSAPVNAWDTGKPFALSAPMALHILTSPEAIEIGVFKYYTRRSKTSQSRVRTISLSSKHSLRSFTATTVVGFLSSAAEEPFHLPGLSC